MSRADEEPTVRIRRDSVRSERPQEAPGLFPTTDDADAAITMLQRNWQHIVASCQRDIEELRAQRNSLLEENRKLRTVLAKVRGR